MSKPLGGSRPGRPRLGRGPLGRLGHRVISFPRSDDCHLFLCMSCKFYSKGRQTLGPGRKCAPPTKTGAKNMRRLRRGLHPDEAGASFDGDEFIPLLSFTNY
eukprot:2678906-Pyramimonas_sp.AAC.1